MNSIYSLIKQQIIERKKFEFVDKLCVSNKSYGSFVSLVVNLPFQ